ncbi:hypothetical protein GCM10023147_40500 [Tsukamurella soli]|uniref:Uncharacterized protein n=1 Tax=Tsukamurella soli TaxID=644556 RepID=A0ABP8K5Z2_9ACTN
MQTSQGSSGSAPRPGSDPNRGMGRCVGERRDPDRGAGAIQKSPSGPRLQRVFDAVTVRNPMFDADERGLEWERAATR